MKITEINVGGSCEQFARIDPSDSSLYMKICENLPNDLFSDRVEYYYSYNYPYDSRFEDQSRSE